MDEYGASLYHFPALIVFDFAKSKIAARFDEIDK